MPQVIDIAGKVIREQEIHGLFTVDATTKTVPRCHYRLIPAGHSRD